MKDPMLRSEIVGVVRRAMSEVLEDMEERWLSPEELCKQFSFFTRDWLSKYGHLLPREKVGIDGGPATHYGYPLHRINRMIAEGKFRNLQWKEKSRKGKVTNGCIDDAA